MRDLKRKIWTISDIKVYSRNTLKVAKYELWKCNAQLENYKVFLTEFLNIIGNVNIDMGAHNPKTKMKKLFVVFSSNYWLCGSVNTKLFKNVISACKSKKDIDVYCVWKKALNFFTKEWFNVVWYMDADLSDLESMSPLSEYISSVVDSKKYWDIQMWFNVKNNPCGLGIYPLNSAKISKFVKSMTLNIDFAQNSGKITKLDMDETMFMDCFAWQLYQYVLYWAFLQNKISENLARKSLFASKRNWFMTKRFVISLNNERQKLLTQKIAEIMSMKMSLEECAIA